MSQNVPVDPLTASIARLAAAFAYPYATFEVSSGVSGLDVLGFRCRVLHASIGLAFGFAEAIACAPQAFARRICDAKANDNSREEYGRMAKLPL
jgi:hypothetical protein